MSSLPPVDPFQRPATRILATLGPASFAPAVIRDLALNGASGFRLNFSHVWDEEHYATLRRAIAAVRAISAEIRRPLAIVGDLCGPKLRTGPIAGGGTIQLRSGEEVAVTPEDPTTTPSRIAINYYGLADDVAPQQRLLLDDGRIELEVLGVAGREVRTRVRHGGALGSKKGLNVPGVRIGIGALTAKDEIDLAFALGEEIDYIALSFAHDARDVVDLKRRISQAPTRAGRTTPVIAKIENPIAVENLGEILEVSDGIMVARGDLGVELGPEELPMVQKQIIGLARKRSKLVITATQMLDSMTFSPSPTRAEASDVANAIFDGTDVVMLSQETAAGSYPVKTVETMRKIALNVEASDLYRRQMEHFQRPEAEGVAQATIRAGCLAAEDVGAVAVVPFSISGWTAFCVSAWRPRTSILACTHLPETYRRLGLAWGTRPVLMREASDLDELYLIGMDTLLKEGALRAGELVVVLTGSLLRGSGANTIKIYRVGTGELSEDPSTRARLQRLAPRRRSRPDDELEQP